MVLLISKMTKIKAVINRSCMLKVDCINSLKYMKVGIIIGKIRICDTADVFPIISAFPVTDIAIIINVLISKDKPIVIAYSILLSKTKKLNIEEIVETDEPNNTQWIKIL